MKLIALHIDGFGKLSDFDYEFDEFYNVILEENGWGKSTFANFIRVMFYGFENETKKALNERERVRFKPWKQTIYGGRITFVDDDGDILTMYRHFGVSAKEDVFELRDEINNLSNKYHENIGEELFHIDSTSFQKTIFFTQNDITSEVTNNVQAKLGNVFMNNDDINRYDEVDEKLNKKINSLSASKNSGELKQLEIQINDLENRIRNKSVIERSINALNKEVETKESDNQLLLKKINELTIKQKEVSVAKDLLGFKESYLAINKDYEERLAFLKECSTYFNGVLPNSDELDLKSKQVIELNNEKINIKNLELDEYERHNLYRLNAMFADGAPSNDELENVKEQINVYDELTRIVDKYQLSDSELTDLEKYDGMFKGHPIDEGKVNEMLLAWNEALNKKSTIESRRLIVESNERQNEIRENERINRIKQKKTIFIFGSIVSLIVGIMLFMFVHKLAGLACGVLGTIFATLSFRYQISAIETTMNQDDSLKEQIKKDEEEISRVSEEIKNFLNKYQKEYVEAMVISYLSDLKRDSEDYERLLKIARNTECETAQLKRQTLAENIEVFLHKYYVTFNGTYSTMILELMQEYKTYDGLLKRENAYQAGLKRVRLLQDDLSTYLNSLHMIPTTNLLNQFDELKINLQNYLNAEIEFKRVEKALNTIMIDERFASLRNLDDELASLSLEDLNYEINLLKEQLNANSDYLKQIIANLDDEKEALDEIILLEEILEQKKEIYISLKTKLDLLVKTRSYLKIAKDSFVEKYMSPIMDGFKKYYAHISPVDLTKYFIDSNFNILYLEDGEMRQKDTLSSGYRDLVGICLRLGLIDAMYHNDKPFLILDDPLVNIDDQKIEKAKEILKQVSETYQVIYFTCHESFK